MRSFVVVALVLIVLIPTACAAPPSATYSCQVWCTSGELQQNIRFDFTATSASNAQDRCFAEKSCTEAGERIHCAKCEIGSRGGRTTNGTSSTDGGSVQPPRTNSPPACVGTPCPDQLVHNTRQPGNCCSGAVCVGVGGTQGLEGGGGTMVCRTPNGTACTSSTECRPNSKCTGGKCCPVSGPCTSENGGFCTTHADCLSKTCSRGMCVPYNECVLSPCSQACCNYSGGFVCKNNACTWGGGGSSSGGTSATCNAPCPDTCDPSVPHQACLYCQAACACAYGKTHPAQCCKPGMEEECQSQLADCESGARESALSLGTTCP